MTPRYKSPETAREAFTLINDPKTDAPYKFLLGTENYQQNIEYSKSRKCYVATQEAPSLNSIFNSGV